MESCRCICTRNCMGACLPVHLQHLSSFRTGDEGPEPKATRVLHGALVMTNNVSTACVRVPSQSVGTPFTAEWPVFVLWFLQAYVARLAGLVFMTWPVVTFVLFLILYCRFKLQALVYSILPPTSAIIDYTIGLEKNGSLLVLCLLLQWLALQLYNEPGSLLVLNLWRQYSCFFARIIFCNRALTQQLCVNWSRCSSCFRSGSAWFRIYSCPSHFTWWVARSWVDSVHAAIFLNIDIISYACICSGLFRHISAACMLTSGTVLQRQGTVQSWEQCTTSAVLLYL